MAAYWSNTTVNPVLFRLTYALAVPAGQPEPFAVTVAAVTASLGGGASGAGVSAYAGPDRTSTKAVGASNAARLMITPFRTAWSDARNVSTSIN
jgi:hypothetical protein